MNRKTGLLASGIVLAFMLGLAALVWPQVPSDAEIPVHWSASGSPNGFAGKWQALLGLPLLTLGLVVAVFVLIPVVEPRRRHLWESSKAYTVTWVATLGLMAILQTTVVLYATGSSQLASVIVVATVGGLFVLVGNYLGKVRSNFLFGIRTPWTLTSEVSWNRTHRLGGRLFVLLGIALIVAALLRNGTFSAFLLLGGLVLIAVVAIIYSYLVWRGDPAKQAFGR